MTNDFPPIGGFIFGEFFKSSRSFISFPENLRRGSWCSSFKRRRIQCIAEYHKQIDSFIGCNSNHTFVHGHCGDICKRSNALLSSRFYPVTHYDGYSWSPIRFCGPHHFRNYRISESSCRYLYFPSFFIVHIGFIYIHLFVSKWIFPILGKLERGPSAALALIPRPLDCILLQLR